MITTDDLNAAPVGSRLIRVYGPRVKTVMHKLADARWQFGYTGATSFAGCSVPGRAMPAWFLENVTLHHPAPVRVTGKDLGDGVTIWSWSCRECGEESFWWLSSAYAHDQARAHQHTAPEPTATRPHAACVHCGIRLPGDLLDAHYAADHGVIGAEQ